MNSSGDSQAGCLGMVLKLFGFNPSQPTPANGPLSYRLRDDFLSSAERSFLGVLKTALSSEHAICPKVNVADILYVARPNETLKYRNMIDRKHVDFLVCDFATMRPLIAIELDDSSHARSDRKDRDEFLDSAFKAAGLPLLHVHAKQSYNTSELRNQIEQALLAKSADSATPTERQPIPLCPKCGIIMVKRTAKQGERSGQEFWGCANYPRCRETVPLS